MNERHLRHFKRTLAAQLEDLVRKERQTVEELLGSDSTKAPDSIDQAANDAGISFRLRIRNREKRLMGKIREALERIEEGTFGICAHCGEEIAIKRLEARPVTTFCIACKSNMETRERAIDSASGVYRALVGANRW